MDKEILVVESGGSGVRLARVMVAEKYVSDPIFPPEDTPVTTPGDLVSFVKANTNQCTVAIAYSAAGFIEKRSVLRMFPNNRCWDGTDLGKLTREATCLPVDVSNDAEASAAGAHVVLPELDYFLSLVWSSGIGGAIWHPQAGVIAPFEGGHICVDTSKDAPYCKCGLQGCVEIFCGGKNVFREVASVLQEQKVEPPTGEKELGQLLDKGFVEKQSWASEIYGRVAEKIGHLLAVVMLSGHPINHVVFKGAFGKAALQLPGIESQIRQGMRNRLPVDEWESRVVFHTLPEDLKKDEESFLGAALLAEKYCLSGK